MARYVPCLLLPCNCQSCLFCACLWHFEWCQGRMQCIKIVFVPTESVTARRQYGAFWTHYSDISHQHVSVLFKAARNIAQLPAGVYAAFVHQGAHKLCAGPAGCCRKAAVKACEQVPRKS